MYLSFLLIDIIKRLDTMQQLHASLCIQQQKTLNEHSPKIEKIKLSKAYISTDVSVNDLKLIDFITDEKWVCVLEKFSTLMILKVERQRRFQKGLLC